MLEVLRLDMGTLDDPDNIPHWSNQAMFFNKLENFRKKQKGFWLMFSQCCGQCGGRGFLENILTDVTAVRQGGKSGDYHPRHSAGARGQGTDMAGVHPARTAIGAKAGLLCGPRHRCL